MNLLDKGNPKGVFLGSIISMLSYIGGLFRYKGEITLYRCMIAFTSVHVSFFFFLYFVFI